MITTVAQNQTLSAVIATLATPILVTTKPLVMVQVEVNGKLECRWVEDR